MKIEIKTLEGQTIIAELADVGPCYPSDDVIYINGQPCQLSTARTPGEDGLKKAHTRLRNFANLVRDFFTNDSAGHARYLKEQAENAIQDARHVYEDTIQDPPAEEFPY